LKGVVKNIHASVRWLKANGSTKGSTYSCVVKIKNRWNQKKRWSSCVKNRCFYVALYATRGVVSCIYLLL